MAKIEGKPEERILSYLMLRSLKQARYSAENTGHFALAASHYTHFTSPIRRYPDLMVHRVLRALLDGERYGNEGEMTTIAEDCSFTERRAAEAERELVEWKKVKFMEDRVGEEFRGADHQHGEVRVLRGTGESVRRGPGADRDAARRPVYVSRECAQDDRAADAAGVFDRR